MISSQGDSGKFGPAMKNVPNSLYKGAKPKPKMSLKQALGRWQGKSIRTRLNNLAGKSFFN